MNYKSKNSTQNSAQWRWRCSRRWSNYSKIYIC